MVERWGNVPFHDYAFYSDDLVGAIENPQGLVRNSMPKSSIGLTLPKRN